MLVPAWKVATWNPVVTTLHDFDDNVGQFTHLGTSVSDEPLESGLMSGQVLWGAQMKDGMVGLAWDWMEVKASVVAMADPMLIISNVRLVDEGGDDVTASERILRMNNVIHALGWQRGLGQLRHPAAQARAA